MIMVDVLRNRISDTNVKNFGEAKALQNLSHFMNNSSEELENAT